MNPDQNQQPTMSQYQTPPTNTPMTPPISAPITPPVINNTVNNNGTKKIGPVIAILVIVLVLIIAALYIFSSRISSNGQPEDSTSLTSNESQSVQPVTNTSDDTASLENDLDASVNGLDNQNF